MCREPCLLPSRSSLTVVVAFLKSRHIHANLPLTRELCHHLMYSIPSHYCDWIPDKKQLNEGLTYFPYNLRVQPIVKAKVQWWEKVLAMVVEVWGSWSHSHHRRKGRARDWVCLTDSFPFLYAVWSKLLGGCTTLGWSSFLGWTSLEMPAMCLLGDRKSSQVDSDESPSQYVST